jgi:hypothetical protein
MHKLSLRASKPFACLGLVSMFSFTLSGCFVPHVLPMLSGVDKQDLLAAVIRGVQCEMRMAVLKEVHDDPRLQWLMKWSAIINLQLSFKNAANFNPGLTLNTPMLPANPYFPGGVTFPASQTYNLGLGGSFSYDATRQEIVDYYFDFGEFPKQGGGEPDTAACYRYGGFTITSDLDLKSWLADALEPIKQCAFSGVWEEDRYDGMPREAAEKQRQSDCPHPRNPITTLSHEIDFDLSFGGSITPTWNLVRVTTNSAPLFGASRTDHSTLLLTLGPGNDAPKDYAATSKHDKGTRMSHTVPSDFMMNRNLAQQIGAAIKDATR